MCYALSEDEEGEKCEFLDMLEELDESFSEDFFAWLLHFKKLCAAHPKQRIESFVKDRATLHDVGKVDVRVTSARGKTKIEQHTIWQFRYHDLRVMWCYAGDDRSILLGNLVVKKKQKTKRSDVEKVGKALQILMDGRADGTLKVVVIESDDEQA